MRTRLGEQQIRVEGLSVRFGERVVLREVSFEVASGETVALLGPNGAGKTTTLSVLAGLRTPDAGAIAIGGFDTATARAEATRVVGLVPQNVALYPSLTALENLLFFAGVAGLRRRAAHTAAERALAIAGLEARRHDRVATFSGGMSRRLNLVCGMLHEPHALLLDEPTVGVDPQSRERIFEAVRERAEAGVGVLWSSHQIEEVERTCDRVLLLDRGKLVASGAPAELVQRHGGGTRLELVTRGPLPAGWEREIHGATEAETQPVREPSGGFRHRVRLDAIGAAPRLLERAAALGGEVVDFEVHHPDLQDVFLALTGRALRD